MGSRLTVAGVLVVLSGLITIAIRAANQPSAPLPEKNLDARFTETVRPMLSTYCYSCHNSETSKSDFNLETYSNLETVESDLGHWMLVRQKLVAKQMPPNSANAHPGDIARQNIIDWIDAVRKNVALKDAGDPGIVLARRLSNSEYNYTIRDLTGFDMQVTREFPVDPSNTAGFDNSGESLAMSPELLDKYFAAARDVADHMYLKQKGFAFAARSMLSEADRDQFCEHQIVDFYFSQDTDYAHYFQAAWQFKNRAALGRPNATLTDIATDAKVSAKYLPTVWDLLEEAKDEVGPVAKLQVMWRKLPAPDKAQSDVARKGCEQMRDYVVGLRKKIEMRFTGVPGAAGQAGSIWLNTQYATHHMNYDAAQLQIKDPSATTLPATAPSPQVAVATHPANHVAGRGSGPGWRAGRCRARIRRRSRRRCSRSDFERSGRPRPRGAHRPTRGV